MATRKETGQRKLAFVQQIRREYQSGELLPGEMLPPVRVLAKQYGLSKRLVNEALQTLAATEGWIVTVPRKGIFVAEQAGASRRFLDHAVIVLSADTRPQPTHRQTGWVDHVAYGALKEIHALGLHSVVLHPDRLCAEVLERLAPEQPYGVAMPETEPDLMLQYGEVMRASGVRVVINSDDPRLSAYDRVTSDHEAGAYQLTRWLLNQNRRNVRLAWSIEPSFYWCEQRQAGYERAMKEAGLRPLPALDCVVEPGLTGERAAETAAFIAAKLQPHLQGEQPLNGLLLASDGVVAPFEAALKSLGLSAGQDVALCGYDNYWQDLAVSGYAPARPTATIDKLNEEQGAQMVQLLLERAAPSNGGGPKAGALHRKVAPRLVVTSALDA